MKKSIMYFEKSGKQNTEQTFQIVKESLKTIPIKKIVLASTTGESAKLAMEYFKDMDIQIIAVAHQFDFSSKTNRFNKELVTEMKSKGHEVHFGTMLFHTDKLFGSSIPIIIADFLRCFSEGYKVCYEIVLMATDAGLLSSGEDIIVIAGTGLGSDTALVMQSASTQNLKTLRIHEILCKPVNKVQPVIQD